MQVLGDIEIEEWKGMLTFTSNIIIQSHIQTTGTWGNAQPFAVVYVKYVLLAYFFTDAPLFK